MLLRPRYNIAAAALISLIIAAAVWVHARPLGTARRAVQLPSWSRCDTDPNLVCAEMNVAGRQGTATGPNTRVKLIGHLSELDSPIRQVFFFDPGGPGLSPSASMSELLDRFPVLDGKGVLLLGIEPQSAIMSNRPECVGLKTEAGCADYLRDLRFTATRESVRRFDAVRAKIGIEKVNFIGFSYGSVTATQYARLYPLHTRALILDGVVSDAGVANRQDPRPPTSRISEGTAAAHLLDRRLQDDCGRSCSPVAVRGAWIATLKRLQHQTYRHDGFLISYDSAVGAMVNILESPQKKGLVKLIENLHSAIIGGRSATGDLVVFEDVESAEGSTRLPAQWTVCSDSGEPGEFTDSSVSQWAQKVFDSTAGFSQYFANDSRVCGSVKAESEALSRAALPEIPVLMYAATQDIVTPIDQAVASWGEVQEGVLVEVPSSRHLSASLGNCSQRQFDTFIQDLSDSKVVVTCEN